MNNKSLFLSSASKIKTMPEIVNNSTLKDPKIVKRQIFRKEANETQSTV